MRLTIGGHVAESFLTSFLNLSWNSETSLICKSVLARHLFSNGIARYLCGMPTRSNMCFPKLFCVKSTINVTQITILGVQAQTPFLCFMLLKSCANCLFPVVLVLEIMQHKSFGFQSGEDSNLGFWKINEILLWYFNLFGWRIDRGGQLRKWPTELQESDRRALPRWPSPQFFLVLKMPILAIKSLVSL